MKGFVRSLFCWGLVLLVGLLCSSVWLHYGATQSDDILNTLDVSDKLLILTRSLGVILFAGCNILEYFRIRYGKEN